MTIKELIEFYSRILSYCEKDLPSYEDYDFPRGYCNGQIDTLKDVITDLKGLEE